MKKRRTSAILLGLALLAGILAAGRGEDGDGSDWIREWMDRTSKEPPTSMVMLEARPVKIAKNSVTEWETSYGSKIESVVRSKSVKIDLTHRSGGPRNFLVFWTWLDHNTKGEDGGPLEFAGGATNIVLGDGQHWVGEVKSGVRIFSHGDFKALGVYEVYENENITGWRVRVFHGTRVVAEEQGGRKEKK